MSNQATTYGPGTLAYLDTFAGLVPCKALKVSADGRDITIRLTAARGAYKRGEILTRSPTRVVPRPHVFTRSGTYRIRGGYTWAAGPERV